MANTDLTNYLKMVRGTRINFNNAFSQDLTQVLDDIDDNFQRLISAPFLQGDKGDSVVRVTEDIYDNNGYLTDFGVAFVNSLYENVLTVDNTWNYQMIKDELFNNHPQTDVIVSNGELYSCELLRPGQFENHINSVDCYKIENDDKEIFVSLIHFHDIRVHYLVESMGPLYGTAFFDRTCTLYGTYDGANWDIRRYETVPTLYYDEQQGFFCWRINGAESGIIAQGVKGDKGDPSKIWVCKGRIFSNADDITIQNNIYLFGVISCSIPDTILHIDNIRQDDIVYVWFDRDDNTTQPSLPLRTPAPWTASDFTVGTAQKQNPNVYIKYFADANLMLITSSFALRECLNRIGYDSIDSPLPSTVRGLFMPNFGESFSNPQSPLSDDNVIMFYSVSNNNEELPFERLSASSSTHIGEVPYNFTYGMNLDNEHVSPLINSERIRLDLDYNEVLFLPKNKQNITKEDDNTYSVHIKNYENNNKLTTELRLNSDVFYKFISLHLPFEQYHLDDNNDNNDSAGLNIGINFNKQVNIGSNTYKNDSQSNLPNIIFNGNGKRKRIYNYDKKSQDENVTLQVNHSSWENNDIENSTYEKYKINNIFNYGLNDILGLNLRHIQHVGISSQSNGFNGRLGLVFNPRAEFVNYDGRDFIRLYTPSIAYVRDCTKPMRNRYTGDGVLGYCKYNSGTPNINSLFESTNDDKGTINELFLYDNIKLRVSSNRNCSFSGMCSYTTNTPHSSLNNNLPIYEAKLGYPNQGFDCPINANINNDYFDVYIGNKNGKNRTYNNNQTDTLIIYNAIYDQNNGYFYGPYYESTKQDKIENYPLCTFEMEKDLKICEDSGQPVYLNRNLYLYGICFKQIENAIDNTKSIQFTYLFTPYWKSLDINTTNVSFDFSMIKSNKGNNTFLNDDGTLALSMDANGNNLPFNFNLEIENEDHNQIINSSKLLKISFIVDFDSSKKRVIGVRPCGSAVDGQIDYSIRNENYDIFNWADVCYNWGYLHKNNLSGYSWESSLYLQPPVNWKLDNNEIERTKNFNIEKGFIEAEIGDNLWSSKPRLRLSPYVSTENFVLWDNNTTKSPIVIRELQTNHEFRSYKLLNRNEYAGEYGVNPNDLFGLTNKIDLSGTPSITKSNKKFFGDYYSNGSISQSLFGYGQNRVDDTSHTLFPIPIDFENQDIPIDFENQVFI